MHELLVNNPAATFYIIPVLCTIIGLLSHTTAWTVHKLFSDVEIMAKDSQQKIIGCQCEIAALKERTKHL